MHKLIIWLLTAITFAPLHGMENTQYQWQELPPELLTKIVACSELTEKDTLRQTCKALQHISSIKNWDIYTHDPLILSQNKTKSIVLLMADQKQETAINNLLSRKVDFSNEPFEFYLHLSQNYQHIAEQLIQNSTIDINAPTPVNASRLYIAAEKGEINTVQLLSKHPKININYLYKNRFTPLLIAAHNGHLGVVKLLAIHPSCILDGLDPDGSTPLYTACQQGHNDVVQFLLTQNVSLDKVLKKDYTLLYFAAQNGHAEAVKVLLSYQKTLINHVAPNGSTALYVAARNGNTEIVELLLKRKDIDTTITNEGYSALYVATQKKHHAIMQLLLTHSPSLINVCTQKRHSPLHCSVCKTDIEGVEILLATPGIDPNIINNNDKTPLDIAYENTNKTIIELLISKSAITADQTKDSNDSRQEECCIH